MIKKPIKSFAISCITDVVLRNMKVNNIHLKRCSTLLLIIVTLLLANAPITIYVYAWVFRYRKKETLSYLRFFSSAIMRINRNCFFTLMQCKCLSAVLIPMLCPLEYKYSFLILKSIFLHMRYYLVYKRTYEKRKHLHCTVTSFTFIILKLPKITLGFIENFLDDIAGINLLLLFTTL